MLILRNIYTNLPLPGISSPVFVLGCGRSGTTILGRALSKHKEIIYLNEPRHLWLSAYPQTDIWTPKARSRGGKLLLTETDVECRRRNRLSRMFQFETIISGRNVLVEKLPINSFRLRFILEMFPDSRFIHIYRNGLEVARSIAKFAETQEWFGSDSYKWAKLTEYAVGRENVKDLPALCTNDFYKGLLEWRLGTEAVVEFLSSRPEESFFEFSYDNLLDEGIETISSILEFLDLDVDQNVKTFISKNLVRKSSKLDIYDVPEKARLIGGKLLPMSMDGKKGLTRRNPRLDGKLP